MKRLAEVCCGSLEDCLAAFKGGCDRIELNSALHLGGLTPSLGSLIKAKEVVTIPIACMVRPRGAGFAYSEVEYQGMLCDAKLLLEHGADGIVFGFLTPEGDLDIERNQAFVKLIHEAGKEAIFHRAFDCVKDPFIAMQQLIDLKIDRVLTSGLEAKAMEGKALIKELQATFGTQIQILAGSGVNASNAKALMDDTGIYQVHSSCKAWLQDCTTHVNPNVSYAYAKENEYDVVDAALVRQLVAVVHS